MFGVVAELRHRLRLALHARQPLRVEALGLDHGEGDVALQLLVVREVDALAPALAEEAPHGVAPAGERRRERAPRLRVLPRGGMPTLERASRRTRRRTLLVRGSSWRAARAHARRDSPPHSSQNVRVGRFSWPQAGHCIALHVPPRRGIRDLVDPERLPGALRQKPERATGHRHARASSRSLSSAFLEDPEAQHLRDVEQQVGGDRRDRS